MEASSSTSSSSPNRTESAAEFVATVRKDHDAMKAWYEQQDPDAVVSPELQRLREQYGPNYPESWKNVLNWNGWKDTRKVYLLHSVQQPPDVSSTSHNNKSSTTAATTTVVVAPSVIEPPTTEGNQTLVSTDTATTNTNTEESKNDATTKPKRKSRWGSVSTTTTTTSTNATTTNGTTTSTTTNGESSHFLDHHSNNSKRGRWGTTELEQLRMQLRALNHKIDHVVEEANRIDALPHHHRERSVSPPPSYVYIYTYFCGFV